MSSKQSWALFCKFGYDLRNCTVTQEQIDAMFSGTLHPKDIPGSVCKREVKPKQDFQAIYNEAREAGLKAGNECVPVPMVVCEHANPLDDKSPVVKRYEAISDGCCGFSNSVIRPGNAPFAIWARKNNLGYKNYYGGYAIPCHDFNQSLTKKEAYCDAFGKVLAKYGIDGTTDSRMD